MSSLSSQQSSGDSQQSSELDVEQYLDLVDDVSRSDHKWIRRILKLLDNIYKLPLAQRGNHLRNFVRCLQLNQQEQANAIEVLKRNLDKKHDPAKIRYIVTKWLIILFYHAQNRAIKGRDAAKVAEKVDPKIAEQVQELATFCREGLHKLNCGHYRASHVECGMNCYGRSTFPDKPLTFDARMSEIVCFKCPY